MEFYSTQPNMRVHPLIEGSSSTQKEPTKNLSSEIVDHPQILQFLSIFHQEEWPQVCQLLIQCGITRLQHSLKNPKIDIESPEGQLQKLLLLKIKIADSVGFDLGDVKVASGLPTKTTPQVPSLNLPVDHAQGNNFIVNLSQEQGQTHPAGQQQAGKNKTTQDEVIEMEKGPAAYETSRGIQSTPLFQAVASRHTQSVERDQMKQKEAPTRSYHPRKQNQPKKHAPRVTPAVTVLEAKVGHKKSKGATISKLTAGGAATSAPQTSQALNKQTDPAAGPPVANSQKYPFFATNASSHNMRELLRADERIIETEMATNIEFDRMKQREYYGRSASPRLDRRREKITHPLVQYGSPQKVQNIMVRDLSKPQNNLMTSAKKERRALKAPSEWRTNESQGSLEREKQRMKHYQKEFITHGVNPRWWGSSQDGSSSEKKHKLPSSRYKPFNGEQSEEDEGYIISDNHHQVRTHQHLKTKSEAIDNKHNPHTYYDKAQQPPAGSSSSDQQQMFKGTSSFRDQAVGASVLSSSTASYAFTKNVKKYKCSKDGRRPGQQNVAMSYCGPPTAQEQNRNEGRHLNNANYDEPKSNPYLARQHAKKRDRREYQARRWRDHQARSKSTESEEAIAQQNQAQYEEARLQALQNQQRNEGLNIDPVVGGLNKDIGDSQQEPDPMVRTFNKGGISFVVDSSRKHDQTSRSKSRSSSHYPFGQQPFTSSTARKMKNKSIVEYGYDGQPIIRSIEKRAKRALDQVKQKSMSKYRDVKPKYRQGPNQLILNQARQEEESYQPLSRSAGRYQRVGQLDEEGEPVEVQVEDQIDEQLEEDHVEGHGDHRESPAEESPGEGHSEDQANDRENEREGQPSEEETDREGGAEEAQRKHPKLLKTGHFPTTSSKAPNPSGRSRQDLRKLTPARSQLSNVPEKAETTSEKQKPPLGSSGGRPTNATRRTSSERRDYEIAIKSGAEIFRTSNSREAHEKFIEERNSQRSSIERQGQIRIDPETNRYIAVHQETVETPLREDKNPSSKRSRQHPSSSQPKKMKDRTSERGEGNRQSDRNPFEKQDDRHHRGPPHAYDRYHEHFPSTEGTERGVYQGQPTTHYQPSNQANHYPQTHHQMNASNYKQGYPEGIPQGLPQGIPQGIPQGLPQGFPQGYYRESDPRSFRDQRDSNPEQSSDEYRVVDRLAEYRQDGEDFLVAQLPQDRGFDPGSFRHPGEPVPIPIFYPKGGEHSGVNRESSILSQSQLAMQEAFKAQMELTDSSYPGRNSGQYQYGVPYQQESSSLRHSSKFNIPSSSNESRPNQASGRDINLVDNSHRSSSNLHQNSFKMAANDQPQILIVPPGGTVIMNQPMNNEGSELGQFGSINRHSEIPRMNGHRTESSQPSSANVLYSRKMASTLTSKPSRHAEQSSVSSSGLDRFNVGGSGFIPIDPHHPWASGSSKTMTGRWSQMNPTDHSKSMSWKLSNSNYAEHLQSSIRGIQQIIEQKPELPEEDELEDYEEQPFDETTNTYGRGVHDPKSSARTMEQQPTQQVFGGAEDGTYQSGDGEDDQKKPITASESDERASSVVLSSTRPQQATGFSEGTQENLREENKE